MASCHQRTGFLIISSFLHGYEMAARVPGSTCSHKKILEKEKEASPCSGLISEKIFPGHLTADVPSSLISQVPSPSLSKSLARDSA